VKKKNKVGHEKKQGKPAGYDVRPSVFESRETLPSFDVLPTVLRSS